MVLIARIAPTSLSKTFYDISHNIIFALSLQTYPLSEMAHYRIEQ